MRFEKKYFIGGAESNYIDYRKKDYKALALDVKKVLKLKHNDFLLDYGCATGLLVDELSRYCYVKGTDISKWAINYGKKNYPYIKDNLHHYNKELLGIVEKVIILDVLEHCEIIKISAILNILRENKWLKQVLVRMPVSNKDGEDFVLEVSKKDKTHIQIHSKKWWSDLFKYHGFKIVKKVVSKKLYDTKGVLVCILEKVKK